MTVLYKTQQEVFDKIATHLLTQKKKSMAGEGDLCVYRDHHGNMCAIGCLISDEDYRSSIEGKDVYNDAVQRVLSKSVDKNILVTFLIALQQIHDRFQPQEWKTKLAWFAHLKELNSEVLNGY